MIKDINAITPEYMKYRIEQETGQYKQEIERLKSIIKEVREYAGELRTYDNDSIEFEISNDIFRILNKER